MTVMSLGAMFSMRSSSLSPSRILLSLLCPENLGALSLASDTVTVTLTEERIGREGLESTALTRNLYWGIASLSSSPVTLMVPSSREMEKGREESERE
jgi:hypothetical protein